MILVVRIIITEMSERAYSYVDERTDSVKKADLERFMKAPEELRPHNEQWCSMVLYPYRIQTSLYQPPSKKARTSY